MPITNETVVEIKVSVANMDLILNGLASLPWGRVNDLVLDLRNQIQIQLKELHNSENVQSLRQG